MPNWAEHVRQSLSRSGLKVENDDEIVEDLAQQLEDAYVEALNLGLNPSQSEIEAKKHITDWLAVAKQVERLRRGSESGRGRFQNRSDYRDHARDGKSSMFSGM